jgi:hypothetical protein
MKNGAAPDGEIPEQATQKVLPVKSGNKFKRQTRAGWLERHLWWDNLGNGAYMKPRIFHP